MLTATARRSCGLVRLLHNGELLNMEIFTTLREAQVLIEQWRRHYNAVRPHSSLGYQPPAPEAILPTASELTCAAVTTSVAYAGLQLPWDLGNA